jgi:hypothetical protein
MASSSFFSWLRARKRSSHTVDMRAASSASSSLRPLEERHDLGCALDARHEVEFAEARAGAEGEVGEALLLRGLERLLGRRVELLARLLEQVLGALGGLLALRHAARREVVARHARPGVAGPVQAFLVARGARGELLVDVRRALEVLLGSACWPSMMKAWAE